MKIQKGYLTLLLIYILLICVFRITSDKLDKQLKTTNVKVIEQQKELTTIKKDVVILKQVIDTNDYIRLKNGDEEQNKVVSYLWNKTHNIDIILTFYGESWLKTATINNNRDKEGNIWSKDYGYCQLNDKYHNEFIKSNNFKNMSSQLDYCIDVYTKAIERGTIHTTFYAYDHRFEKRIRSQFIISQEAVDITYKK